MTKETSDALAKVALDQLAEHKRALNGNLQRMWEAQDDLKDAMLLKFEEFQKSNSQEHMSILTDALKTATDRWSKKEAVVVAVASSVITGLIVGIIARYV